VDKIARLLTAAVLAALLLGPAAVAAADDDEDESPPTAQTGAATPIADRSATLTAQVTPRGETTSFRFEYGPTTSYGQSTAAGTLAAGNATRAVTAAIEGLTPGTLYHFRVRAWNQHGTSTGGDRTFTTTASAATPTGTPPPSPPDPDSTGTPPAAPANPDAGASDGASPSGSEVAAPPSAAAPEPELGRSMAVAPLQGTIKIKPPGSSGFTTLAAGDSVPVGTLVDTRRGTVKLTSALGTGTTQAGEFRGALFQVRQPRAGRGTTDIVLRGGDFGRCPRTSSRRARAATASARRPKPPTRRLWARDKGGRFRTHGRNSVATVRGTSWVTTDTCAGTRTRVTEGAVAVRDRHRGKTVLVRAGHSYLAPSAP
jgi:hypothetical protein